MKILIVEDEALIAALVVEHLEEAGHAIIGPAATAGEALDLCREDIPELAILDINLQDGSSGIEVARELFARWGLVAIFASGEVLAARQAQDVALGYLPKPYEMAALLQSVEAVEAMRAGSVPRQVPLGFEAFPHLQASWAGRLPAPAGRLA
ncbi:response regulator [Roseomonas sp. M0104]|uniref:Response regulator n=1 Tax=Teichococcus coralli TaxID=2545983 RepID=A0A845BE38_9PROT|nr:response regulator [Pseudoroseomonas coralli]MXP65018.1 response regulator [Pseudoroseomonas coralli]